MKNLNIAVFGSAFNPPTYGHASVLERLTHFDEVWLVPSFAHAWGKKMAPFEQRCQWLQCFIDELQQDNLRLCAIEASLAPQIEGITTHKLLSALQAQHPNHKFTFVIGPDNLLNFSKFSHYEDILRQWNVLTCPQTRDIRSTHIRERLAQHQSIDDLTTPILANRLTHHDFHQTSV